MNLGGIYKDLGNLDHALASTLKSLELKPNNPDAHMNLGGIFKDLGNLDQALASTLKSLELKPDNPRALSNLCSTYREGDLPVLKSTARRALEHNQEILNNLTYVEVLSSLGKDFAKNIISTIESNQSVNFQSTRFRTSKLYTIEILRQYPAHEENQPDHAWLLYSLRESWNNRFATSADKPTEDRIDLKLSAE